MRCATFGRFDPLKLSNQDRSNLLFVCFFSLVTVLPNFITMAILEVGHMDVLRLKHSTHFRQSHLLVNLATNFEKS